MNKLEKSEMVNQAKETRTEEKKKKEEKDKSSGPNAALACFLLSPSVSRVSPMTCRPSVTSTFFMP